MDIQLGEKDTASMSIQRKKNDKVDTANNIRINNVEIRLTNKMRALVEQIDQRVVIPYKKARKEKEKQHFKSIKMINKRFEVEKSVINKEFLAVESKVEIQVNRLNEAVKKAETNTQNILGAKINEDRGLFSSKGQHDNPEKKAQLSFACVQSALENIGSAEEPWDVVMLFLAGLGIFVVTAFMSAMLDHLPGYFVFIAPLSVFLQPLLAKGKYQKYISKLREGVIETHYWLDVWLEQAYKEAEKKLSPEQQATNAERKRLDEELRDSHTELREQFTLVLDDLQGQITRFIEEIGVTGAIWGASIWQQWAPVSTLIPAVRLGRLSITTDVLSELGSKELSLPALIPFNNDGRSLLFDASESARNVAVAAVEGFILRLLATLPPGKLRLTFIDPVGLGQQVAGFMRLTEYGDALITGKVCTDSSNIEQCLAELTEDMEDLIQKKLRSEYATIEDYNEESGKIAEPYRLLVVMDFPVNFTEVAAHRLVSIVENGPRCGVHTVIVAVQDKPWPYGFKLADLERNATVFKSDGDHFVWQDRDFKPCRLELDESPPNDLVKRVIKTIGPLAVDAMKVEVSFESLDERYHVSADTGWGDATTQNEIEIPLGPGAQTNQLLRLGVGLEHHALIVGRPGSGKSNLMHVIIMGMALKYPPSELELYLVDFKGGVEFEPYGTHRLPHARAVAIESEREFGISILRRLDVEMDQRQTIFRKAGVKKLAHYREQKPEVVMPRIVLLVDEFQDFFATDDRITGEARKIFDHLVRKGRNAGLHIILGSQSISGDTLLSTTVNLITIRIAFQCSETDSRMILADNNTAARKLTRPGQAIYNNLGGLLEGNSEFQVALYTEQDCLDYPPMILSWANAAKGREKKFIENRELTVFEGNELPHIEACKPLMDLLTTEAPIESSPRTPQLWLGEAIEIGPAVTLQLYRRTEANILIITRAEEEGIGLCLLAQISLLAQQREGDVLIYNFDLTTEGAAWVGHAEEIRNRFGGEDRIKVLDCRKLESALVEVDQVVQSRLKAGGSGGGAPILVVFQGLHRIRDLRGEGSEFDELEEGSPRTLLARILKDGPRVGVHTIAWADTLTNAKRCLDYEVLREFGFRIAGALSREDSQNLLDAPDASWISKPHWFLLFEEDRPGILTLFRPYAIPGLDGFRELLTLKTSL